MIGDFQNRKSMEIASARFVQALVGNQTVRVENVAEPRLKCGHDIKNRYGNSQCRACRAERSRSYYLREAIPATRRKLEMLENEARRRGQIV